MERTFGNTGRFLETATVVGPQRGLAVCLAQKPSRRVLLRYATSATSRNFLDSEPPFRPPTIAPTPKVGQTSPEAARRYVGTLASLPSPRRQQATSQ